MADKYRRTLTLDLTQVEALALGESDPVRKAAALTAYLRDHREHLEPLAALFLPPGQPYALMPGSVIVHDPEAGEPGENGASAGLIRGSFTMHFSQGCADREDSDDCPFELSYVLGRSEIVIWADALPERDTRDEF